MILQPKDTTVAYRCPVCGTTVLSVVGALALSGDMIKLKCTCGCSELVMQKADEGKLRLTVPCIFCPSPHHYVVSRKLLMTRELFTFPCAYAGIDILFVGSKGAVLKASEESDKRLAELLKKLDIADDHTRFIANHITHNKAETHEKIEEIFEGTGIEVSYDGKVIEV